MLFCHPPSVVAWIVATVFTTLTGIVFIFYLQAFIILQMTSFNLIRFFRRKKKVKSVNELYCYQESARIVMAYAFGYRCLPDGFVSMNITHKRTELDFKKDTFVVNALTNYCDQPYILDSVVSKYNSLSTDFTERLCMILLSGWVARKIYNSSVADTGYFEIGREDNRDLRNIEQFIAKQENVATDDFRSKLIGHTEQFVKIKSVWHAVESTAKRLIRSSQGMDREQIEIVLRGSPFWQFIKG